jgi:hypothetical protein
MPSQAAGHLCDDRRWKQCAAVVLRSLDGFGNIRPRPGNTWIDFPNVVKYPPSMTFTLMTMGNNSILLSVFAQAAGKAQLLFQ